MAYGLPLGILKRVLVDTEKREKKKENIRCSLMVLYIAFHLNP